MIWLKRIFISIFIFLLFFILSGAFIAHFYGKEVTRYIIDEIGKNVNTEIHVREVGNLSVFEKFPYASMVLHDVMVKETVEKKSMKDTLLYLKKIYLQFNIIDILQSNYHIKRISASDGFVRMKVYKKGKENYLNTANSENKNEPFLMNLSRFSISNTDIFYVNELKEQNYNIHCNEAVLKGNFSNEKFLLSIGGNFYSEHLITEDIHFLSKRNLALKTELDIDKLTGIYSVKKGEITVDNKMSFNFSGKISEGKNPERASNPLEIYLELTSKNLDITSAVELLPQKSRESFSEYAGKGIMNFDCKIKGEVSNEKTPEITANFSVSEGFVKQKSASYSLQNIQLKGKYSNGKNKNPESSVVIIEECSATLGKGKIEATFILKNLNNPQVNLSLSGKFELEDLHHFVKIDTLENISGLVTMNINYEGALKSKEEFSAQDFRNSKSSGNVIFQEMNFLLKESPLVYRNFSGKLFLKNNDIVIREMKGNVSSSGFELNGLFRNALAYLFLPEENLIVEAAFSSDNLNLDELLAENENKNDPLYLLTFPEHINFNLSADIAALSFRKFNANELTGIITVRNKILRSDKISFKTMDGTVNSTLEIDAADYSAIIVSSYASVSNIDISKLFYSFENFNQNVITDKNLKGTATAEIRFVTLLDSTLNTDQNRIYSIADLTIENGELINFEPMNNISGFIKNHVFLKRIIKGDEFEKKLKHIYFSSLKNQVEIKNKKITVPSMNIKSSAINIEAEGTHTFDNIVDYKINFFVSELLMKKEEVARDEFGEIEDDGTGKKKIFLTITGNIDKPLITYDKKKVKKNIQQEALKEKQVIKGILKDELGLFRKDTAAINKKKEPKEDFMIEWGEKNPQVDSSQSEKAKAEKKNNNLKKMLEKLNKEDGKKKEDFELEKGEDF